MDSESMQAYREEYEPESGNAVGLSGSNALVRLQCWPMTTLDEESRGQYTTLGDGKNKKTIVAKKGDQTIVLDEDDIIEMRRAIAFFDMSIRSL